MSERQESTALLDSLRAAAPAIREHGAETEERGRISGETLGLLDRAGAFRMAVPERFGGLDLPLARQAEAVEEIARACPATGWNMTVWLTGVVMAGLFPDRAQKEVFGGGAARVSLGFAPTGRLTPVDGGYRLTGRWSYNSGCHAADWDLLASVLERPDGGTEEQEEEFFALVPLKELSVVDDWDVSAGRGTGSATVVAEQVFVPAHRLIPYEGALTGETGERWNARVPGRGYGAVAFIMTLYSAMATGIARGAYELFLERVPGRGITYTSWEDQRQHPLTQQQVAAAANRIDAGSALTGRVVALLQERADAGVAPTDEEKAQARGRSAFAADLAKEAVELLYSMSGASVIKRSVPFQRYHRDLLGFSLHALAQVHTNLEVQGRVLLGLDPGSDIL
ncbi:acyl-CoA dehydrogenase family protein [Streptomyces sp. NPDC048565]|uniref:acyl-CoA dehydrogenase family protein n=1 Tax=Streptomyces sp. NPDC048565 TaxID=3155266 RepID=UPI00343A1B33